ncbi:MAG: NfeD family protein [Desulfosarcina sp.]|nr:NfeD family protein [Desulfobacterales bacterium]
MFKEPAMVWFIIGLACVLAEFALPGLIIIFFGIGAWCSALLLLALDVTVFFQILIFILCSILSLIFLRKRVSFKKEDSKDVTEDFIGKRAKAEDSFTKGEFGKVFFKGTFWKAETLSESIIRKGEYVKITGQESLTLLVEPLNVQE